MRRRLRLSGAESFERLRRQGRRWRHPLIVLVAAPNSSAYTRFGFSASKRVGNAVQRNRAKRLLREAAREQMAHIEPGWDCLLVARKSTADATLTEVKRALLDLLERASLVQPVSGRERKDQS